MADGYMGGTLSDEETRTLLHAVSVEAEGIMRRLAEAYVAEVTKSVGSAVSKLFGKAKKVLRTAFLAAALVLHGPSPMVADERVIFAQQVVAQQAFLQNFQAEVVGGSQPPDGTLVSRAGMYGQSAWAVGQNTARGIAGIRGKTEERRVLGAEDGRNCEVCPELADLAWQPIGSLPALGDTPCLTACRCHFEYRGKSGKAMFAPKAHHEGHEGGKPGKKPQGHWVTHEGRHLFIGGPDPHEGEHAPEHHHESGSKGGIGSHVVATHHKVEGEKIEVSRRRFSEHVENHVAKATNGKHITGNKPSDVDVPKPGGGTHKIEVKSKSFGSKKELSVHPGALHAKATDAAANPKDTWHTVLVDARHDSEGGAHRESYSGHDLYYKRAAGRYRLEDMHKVKDVAELHKLMDTPHHLLPKAAQGEFPGPKALKEMKEKADKDREYNNARSKVRKARLGREAYRKPPA